MKIPLPLLSYTLPTAEMVERAKMAIARKSSPVFHYTNRSPFDPEFASKTIREHKHHVDADPEMHEVLRELEQLRLDEQIIKCDLIKAIQEGNDASVTQLSEQLYGSCDQSPDYFENILEDLYERSPLPALKNDISSSEAKQAFRDALNNTGLSEWTIVEEDRINVAIRKAKGLEPGSLRLPKDFATSRHRLAQLIAHEVQVHAKRLESGRQTGIEMFANGTAGYLSTEEGLALYLQEEAAPSRYLPPGFWQAYAIAIAKEQSFYDTYQTLLKARKSFYSWIGRSDAQKRAEQSALRLSVRSYAGITKTADTSAVFMKGVLYFNAYKDLKGKLDSMSDEERSSTIKNLLSAKIGLNDLRLLNRLPEELNPLVKG